MPTAKAAALWQLHLLLLVASALAAVMLLAHMLHLRLRHWQTAQRDTTQDKLLQAAALTPAAADSRAADQQLLLYKRDSESRKFLQKQWQSGEMLKLVKKLVPKARRIRDFYPNLTLEQFAFTKFDRTPLQTSAVVQQLLHLHRNSTHRITNTIHYFAVAKGNAAYKPSFKAYLGFLSGLWLSGADSIVIWCNRLPEGRYWDMFVRNVTRSSQQHRIFFGSRPLPLKVFNIAINPSFISHNVDVMKLETAILFGGFVLDNDAVVVRSLQPLRLKACVIGKEAENRLTMGMFGSQPSATFILLWYMEFQNYDPSSWAKFAIQLPAVLWKRFQNLCEVQEKTFARPSWMNGEVELLYGDKGDLDMLWNWRRNYIVHLWRNGPSSHLKVNEDSAMKLNSLFGEVARFVMTGDERLR